MKDAFIRLPVEQIEWLDSRAKGNFRSRSAEVRQILLEMMTYEAAQEAIALAKKLEEEGPPPKIQKTFTDSQGVTTLLELPNPAFEEWKSRQKKGRKK